MKCKRGEEECVSVNIYSGGGDDSQPTNIVIPQTMIPADLILFFPGNHTSPFVNTFLFMYAPRRRMFIRPQGTPYCTHRMDLTLWLLSCPLCNRRNRGSSWYGTGQHFIARIDVKNAPVRKHAWRCGRECPARRSVPTMQMFFTNIVARILVRIEVGPVVEEIGRVIDGTVVGSVLV